MAFPASIIFSLAALAQGSVSSINCGIKITLSADAPITEGKLCIPQCKRSVSSEGYQNDAGAPLPCENTITITATIENVGYPGTIPTNIFTWLINGDPEINDNGGIELVGVPSAFVVGTGGIITSSVTIKSRASNWNWTPGTVALKFAAPPVPIYCPGQNEPISTCPGCSGVSPLLIVYKEGVMDPEPGEPFVIIGPQCVKAGERYLYAVINRFTKREPSFGDGYKWNVRRDGVADEPLPNSMSYIDHLYQKNIDLDKSSIWIEVLPAFTGGDLKVVAGTGNNCNANVYSMTLKMVPNDFKILMVGSGGTELAEPIEGSVCRYMDDQTSMTFKVVPADAAKPLPTGKRFSISFLPNNGFNPAPPPFEVDAEEEFTITPATAFTCPNGYAGSLSAKMVFDCPVPNSSKSAGFAIKRKFRDHFIYTIPEANRVCIDNVGEAYNFYIDGVSCNAGISWNQVPKKGWYDHEPQPTLVGGAAWGGHIAFPPPDPATIMGSTYQIKAKDGCDNEITYAKPVIVSTNSLEVELELTEPEVNGTKCPIITAKILNLPKECCTERFEFVWTHQKGDIGFCKGENPSGCGVNKVAIIKSGWVALTVKTCKSNPCETCLKSERFTVQIPSTPQWLEYLQGCYEDGWCPEPTKVCFEETDPIESPQPARPILGNNLRPSGITILPNPAGKQFTVNLLEAVEEAEFQIIDIFGKVIKSGKVNGKSFEVKSSRLPKGNYTLKIIGNSTVWSEKLIIE